MRAANLPYQIIGGTRFYDRAEVKDVLAYLRVLVNPKSDVDLLRIVNVPARGIGQTTIDRSPCVGHGQQGSRCTTPSRAQERSTTSRRLPGRSSPPSATWSTICGAPRGRCRPASRSRRSSPTRATWKVLEKEDSAEADARAENLQELVGSLVDYEAEAEAAGEPLSLAGYLERVTLVSDVDALGDAPRVVMMTVHGAKGLEFERVVLTGMEEEMFPYKGVDPGEHEELEEERRLAYVAITRARKRLFMTHTQTRQIFGTTRWNRPSRFLSELPRDAAEHVATAALGREGGRERYIDRDHAPAAAAARRAGPRPAVASPAAERGAGACARAGRPLRRSLVLRRPVARRHRHALAARRSRAARPLRRGRGAGGDERRRAGGGRVLSGVGREEDPGEVPQARELSAPSDEPLHRDVVGPAEIGRAYLGQPTVFVGSSVSQTSVAPQLMEGLLVPQCWPTMEQLDPIAGQGAPPSSTGPPASVAVPHTGTPR